MVGHGLATIVGSFTNTKISLEEGTVRDEDLLGLGDAIVDQETLLTGLDKDAADEELLGLSDAAVQNVPPYELTSLF
jgi:hypothetical protein